MIVFARTKEIKRGDIYYANLGNTRGSEQGGLRPFLIVSCNTNNKFAPIVNGVCLSSNTNKRKIPPHVFIKRGTGGLPKDSIVLTEQIRTLDVQFLGEKIGTLDVFNMSKVNIALLNQMGINNNNNVVEVSYELNSVCQTC